MRAVIRRSGRPTPTVGWRLAEREDGWPFNSDKENEPSPDATSHTKSADRVASLSFPAAPDCEVPIGGFAAVRNDKGIDQADFGIRASQLTDGLGRPRPLPLTQKFFDNSF